MTVAILVIAAFWAGWSRVGETESLRLATSGIGKSRILDTQWQYHWGDLPRTSGGDFEGLRESGSGGRWKSFDPSRHPPGKEDHRIVWYRVKLPQDLDAVDTLYVPGTYQLFQIFVGEKLVYRFGEFDEGGRKSSFKGQPFHVLPLNPSDGGDYLYFRIYSTYSNIGFAGPVRLGTRAGHLLALVRHDMGHFAIGILYAFLGMFQVFLFRKRRTLQEYLAFGSFVFLFGMHTIARTHLKELFWDAPLTWKHIEYGSLYLIPLCLCLFVRAVFSTGYRNSVRRLAELSVGFSVVTLGGSLMGWIAIQQTLAVFQYLFIPGALLLVTALIPHLRKGEPNAVVFVVGLVACVATAELDAAVVSGRLPYMRPLAPWGVLVFVFALQMILSRRLANESREKAMMEQDLETAAILTRDFLPSPTLTARDFEMKIFFQPAGHIGGDWFSYYTDGESLLHVHLGDVTGHGPASAMLAAFSKGACDMHYLRERQEGERFDGEGLVRLHADLNRMLGGTNDTDTFMTMFSLSLDARTGELSYINSGHVAQLLHSPGAGRKHSLTRPRRSLLGVDEPGPMLPPERLVLRGDETLFLFSDGLLERLHPHGVRAVKKMERNLEEWTGESPEKILQLLRAQMDVRNEIPRQADDMTFIVIKVKTAASAGGHAA